MREEPNRWEDEVGRAAEEFEAGLVPGTAGGSSFEQAYPGLAKTIRMLNMVFQPIEGGECNAADLPRPRNIGRFQVIRQVGNGNFGSVWLADDPVLKRQVAIKVAHVGVHARADLQERFIREAELAARLHHPNIVPVFESGVADGRLFIVSEFCDGDTLASWLERRARPVAPDVAANLIRQLADAVQHAHRQGLIHRDIKPGNVLLTFPAGDSDDSAIVPRLTDFGLARDLESTRSATRTGAILGTVAYMPPEQATGNVAGQGPAADVYSLGVLLYQLLTGQVPFTGASDFEVILRIRSAYPIAPSTISRGIPRDLSSICLKCLEKDPAKRYESAAELQSDLGRFLRHEPTHARPIGVLEKLGRWTRANPTAATSLSAVLLLLAAIIAGMALHQRQAARHARDLTSALEVARGEREAARHAREQAETERRAAREAAYVSDMRLAFDQWKRGDVHQLARTLARQLPAGQADLRGPEWHVLAADHRVIYREIGRHEGAVTECRLTADEKRVVSAGTDGLVRIWDIEEGEMLGQFDPGLGELHALGISPDDARIAVGGKPGLLGLARVAVLDADSGEQVRILQTHTTTIESIAFSPDGRWLAAGSRYQPVRLTELASGETFTLPATRRNRSMAFSSDSRFLVVAADADFYVVWRTDGEEPIPLHPLPLADARGPYVAAFAPDSPLVVVGHQNSSYLAIFDAARPALRTVLFSAADHSLATMFSCVAIDPDGRWLVAGDDTGTIQVWEADAPRLVAQESRYQTNSPRNRPITTLAPHLARVSSVTIRRDHTVVSAGEDGRVVLSQPFRTGVVHVGWRELQVNDSLLDGDELFLACEDGSLRRLRLGSAQLEGQGLRSPEPVTWEALPDIVLRLHTSIRSLAISADGRIIATGTAHGGLRLHNRETLELIRVLEDDVSESADNSVTAIRFGTTSSLLAHTGQHGRVVLHDTTNGSEVYSWEVGSTGYALAFLGDDRYLACGGRFENIRILDIPKRRYLRSYATDNTFSLAVSHDGNWLASAHGNGTLRIVDTRFTQPSRLIRGHREFGLSNTFAPSNRTMISAAHGGELRFTAVEAGETIGSWRLSDLPENAGDVRVHCTDHHLVVNCWADGPESHLFVWDVDGTRKPGVRPR